MSDEERVEENATQEEPFVELPNHIVTPTLSARLVVPGMCLLAIVLALFTQWKPGSGSFNLALSDSGIKVRYVDRVTVTPDNAELSWLSEDELLSQDTAIIRGTVFSAKNVEIDFGGGNREYRAILGVEITDVLRGTLNTGDVISVLVPVPLTDGATAARLTVGAEVILLPKRLNETRTVEKNDKKLYLMELSGFELPDGERYAFSETDGALSRAVWAYPSLDGAQSLDEVEAFIRAKIS